MTARTNPRFKKDFFLNTIKRIALNCDLVDCYDGL